MKQDEIIFNDPAEDLESLLETHKAPVEEIDHSKIVQEIQKASQVKHSANRDQGEQHPQALLHEKKDRTLAINGQVMKESEARDILSQEIDGESFNFLISKQKQKLEPAELSIVGKDRRYPDVEECDSVIGHKCKFCGEEISQSEASWKEIGGLCFYGVDSEGQPQVYHWACLALHALLICKGHPLQAAEKFNLDPDEMTAIKMFYRSIPWGRLGFTREGQ